MDKTIMFTPSEVVAIILAVCAGVVTISGAITVIAGWINKAKAPEKEQDRRITDLEKRVDTLEASSDNDGERLKQIEESNRITQRGMLALLKHSINGEDTESLRRAEKDLENYLIDKG